MSYHNPDNPNYSSQNLNSPYAAGDPYYNQSTGYISPPNNEKPKGKSTSKWIKFGIPIALLVIIAVVVGAVVGVKESKKSSTSSSPAAQSAAAAAQSSSSVNAVLAELATGKFAAATNSLYMVPIWPQVVSLIVAFLKKITTNSV